MADELTEEQGDALVDALEAEVVCFPVGSEMGEWCDNSPLFGRRRYRCRFSGPDIYQYPPNEWGRIVAKLVRRERERDDECKCETCGSPFGANCDKCQMGWDS